MMMKTIKTPKKHGISDSVTITLHYNVILVYISLVLTFYIEHGSKSHLHTKKPTNNFTKINTMVFTVNGLIGRVAYSTRQIQHSLGGVEIESTRIEYRISTHETQTNKQTTTKKKYKMHVVSCCIAAL